MTNKNNKSQLYAQIVLSVQRDFNLSLYLELSMLYTANLTHTNESRSENLTIKKQSK